MASHIEELRDRIIAEFAARGVPAAGALSPVFIVAQQLAELKLVPRAVPSPEETRLLHRRLTTAVSKDAELGFLRDIESGATRLARGLVGVRRPGYEAVGLRAFADMTWFSAVRIAELHLLSETVAAAATELQHAPPIAGPTIAHDLRASTIATQIIWAVEKITGCHQDAPTPRSNEQLEELQKQGRSYAFAGMERLVGDIFKLLGFDFNAKAAIKGALEQRRKLDEDDDREDAGNSTKSSFDRFCADLEFRSAKSPIEIRAIAGGVIV